jgi:hypothetical protein
MKSEHFRCIDEESINNIAMPEFENKFKSVLEVLQLLLYNIITVVLLPSLYLGVRTILGGDLKCSRNLQVFFLLLL